jgi:hypothetical protein
MLALTGFTVYDLNGGSFDLSDREVLLVVTDSMDGDSHEYEVGSFPANTLVMVEHLSDFEKRFLRVGDVVSYHDGSGLTHHRIVQMDGDYVYVHGDNNHYTERVSYDDINGKVVGTNHVLGEAAVLLQENYWPFLVLMFILCVSLIALSFYRSSPEKEAD